MTAAAIIIGTLVMAACLFAFALCRVSAQSDRDARRAHYEHMMRYRYKGGDLKPCRVCGELVVPSYSDDIGPIHATCREDAA
jgi:hypothetical protein